MISIYNTDPDPKHCICTLRKLQCRFNTLSKIYFKEIYFNHRRALRSSNNTLDTNLVGSRVNGQKPTVTLLRHGCQRGYGEGGSRRVWRGKSSKQGHWQIEDCRIGNRLKFFSRLGDISPVFFNSALGNTCLLFTSRHTYVHIFSMFFRYETLECFLLLISHYSSLICYLLIFFDYVHWTVKSSIKRNKVDFLKSLNDAIQIGLIAD